MSQHQCRFLWHLPQEIGKQSKNVIYYVILMLLYNLHLYCWVGKWFITLPLNLMSVTNKLYRVSPVHTFCSRKIFLQPHEIRSGYVAVSWKLVERWPSVVFDVLLSNLVHILNIKFNFLFVFGIAWFISKQSNVPICMINA